MPPIDTSDSPALISLLFYIYTHLASSTLHPVRGISRKSDSYTSSTPMGCSNLIQLKLPNGLETSYVMSIYFTLAI